MLLRFVVYGLWFMVYGLWFVVCGCGVTLFGFSGIDAPVLKSATVTSPTGSDGVCTFLPIRHNTVSTVRLAIEPLNPAELPRMVRP